MKRKTELEQEIESNYEKDNSNTMILSALGIMAFTCAFIWYVVSLLEIIQHSSV